MTFKRTLAFVLILVLIPVGYALYLLPTLPESIPTHFGVDGKADTYGPKSSIFLAPAILGVVSLFVFLLLSNIKKIDPKRAASLEDKMFLEFGFITVAFMSLLSIVILYSTSHEGAPTTKLILGATGILFLGMGYYMPKIKQNYFAGFKLPWTLDNEFNWNATHQLAGKLWTIGGALIILNAILFEAMVLFVIFISIITIMSVIPIAYSFLLFKKGNK